MFSNSKSYDRDQDYRPPNKDSASSTSELTPAQGEEKYYFLFHSLLSSLCFALAIYFLELEKRHPYSDLYWVFSLDFLIFYLICIGLSYLFSGLSRLFVYSVMNIYYRDMGQFITPLTEIESSHTGLFSYFHLLRTLLGMLIYCIGVVAILQTKLFEDNTLLSLILSYLLVQLIVNAIAYYMAKKRRKKKQAKYLKKYEKYSKK